VQPPRVGDQQLNRGLDGICTQRVGAQRRREVLETGSESGIRSTVSTMI
jgi:hypothetical protein